VLLRSLLQVHLRLLQLTNVGVAISSRSVSPKPGFLNRDQRPVPPDFLAFRQQLFRSHYLSYGIFNSGTPVAQSRIVCCSISSGFSVDSIIPPKSALIEREIPAHKSHVFA